MLYEGRTSKKSIYIELPAEPHWLIVFYESNSGHRYLDFYEFQRNPEGIFVCRKVFYISDMEFFVDKIARLPVPEDLKIEFIAWLSG